MADWTPSGNFLLGQNIDETSTTKHYELGTRTNCKHSTRGVGEFIYLQGVASTAVGSLVLYNSDDYSTSLATANDTGSLAVAMSANVASSYGWYQIKGKGSVAALTGFVDNADCYLTATAGSIDDAVVSGDLIYGMRGASAVSGGLADVEIDYPYSRDGELLDSTAITASAAEINRTCDVSARLIAAGATLTLTQATHDGTTVVMDQATGSALTLPAATGTGMRLRVVVSVTVTSNNHTIACVGTDEFAGQIIGTDTDTSDTLASYPAVAADNYDTITMDGSTKGGLQGDVIELEDVASGVWALQGFIKQTGTTATPLSSAV